MSLVKKIETVDKSHSGVGEGQIFGGKSPSSREGQFFGGKSASSREKPPAIGRWFQCRLLTAVADSNSIIVSVIQYKDNWISNA